jgi:NADPH-dependent 2,4-dienoyl-CoA reductase/sulfur reductase-like enzyme
MFSGMTLVGGFDLTSSINICSPIFQAVVGAGAAGLVAARELRREGHLVTVYEQGPRIGGIWVFDEATEDGDPLGIDDKRKRVR